MKYPFCRHHRDDSPCPVKMAQEAAEIVAACKSDKEAGRVAVESMRTIARAAGVTVKPMPDVTKSEVEHEVTITGAA